MAFYRDVLSFYAFFYPYTHLTIEETLSKHYKFFNQHKFLLQFVSTALAYITISFMLIINIIHLVKDCVIVQLNSCNKIKLNTSLNRIGTKMLLYKNIITCTKVFIKEMLTTHTFLKDHKLLLNILSTIFACLTLFLLAPIILICLIKNNLIKLFLKLRYDEKYGNVSGMDSYFECTKNQAFFVNIVEHSGSIEELQIIIKKSTTHLLQSHYKFSSTIHNIFGVYYYLKNQVFLNDVFSIENIDVSSKDLLKNYMEKHCFSDFDDKSLWKVILFETAIKWNEMDNSKTYYAILIRFNHCLGDAIALSMYLQQYFYNNVKSKYLEKLRNNTESKDVFNRSNLGSVLFAGPKLNYTEINLFPSHQKLAVFMEHEPKYIRLIKYISKQLNCSFTDVIIICAMSSITNYLNMEGVKTTNFIVSNTSRPRLGDNINLILEQKELSNNFTMEAFNLPLKHQNILIKFKEILPILRDGRNSDTGQIIYWIIKLLSNLHPKLLRKFARLNSEGATLGITNIPFADYCKIGTSTVQNMFTIPNNFENTKFVMVVATFQDKLQTALITKKNLKVSREELQEILNNCFLNIDRLYEEVKLNEIK
nr:uncharacterized protein LOC111427766 [Onthophagus taurus]